MDDTQTELLQKLNAAVLELAPMLEPRVLKFWQAECDRFNEARERGEVYPMTPLSLALSAAVWERATTGEPLFFPPEAAAHYARAPRAHTN